MTKPEVMSPVQVASVDERLAILAEELELAVKWQRPCILLAVYTSEFVRADVDAALQNSLIDLGQKCVHLSVRNRSPKDLAPFFKELKNPRHSVFVVDGLHWGNGDENSVYSVMSLQREYFVDRRIRIVFWLTPNEIVKLAHAAPEFWAHRHRVVEFVEAPRAERVLRETMDSTWQAARESAPQSEDTDAGLSQRESMLSELPPGEESNSARGNLLLTMGVLNWRRGDFKKADEQLHDALRIASRMGNNLFEAECFNALALIKSSTDRIDEAIEAYKQAIQLAPEHVFVWNNLGNLCSKVGRTDEAMIAFRKALQGNPRDAIAWNGLANLHFRLGYSDDAIKAYRRAIQYTPSLAQPWCGLGDVYGSLGRAEEAAKCYRKAIDLNGNYVAPWIRLGKLLTGQDQHREAVKAYQQALDLDGENSEVWNELGTVHLMAEAFDEAAAAFSKAIELDRGNGWAYGNLALAYMQQGKHKETVSLLLRSVELVESNADKAACWNRLASAYRLLNDYDNAVAAYQMADQLSSMEETSNAEQAPEVIEPAPRMEERPAPSPANAEASPIVEEPVEQPAGAKPTFAAQALSMRADPKPGRPSDAPAWIFIPMSETGILEPDHPAAVTPATAEMEPAAAIGSSTSQPSATAGAVTEGLAASTATADTPGMSMDAAAWTQEGNAFFSQGAYEEAIAAYNAAIQLEPSYGVPYGNLALTYLSQGQCAEAIPLYEKSIEYLKSDRDKALSWNGLGNAYRGVGDYVHAVAAYQHAAELDPETSGIRDWADEVPSNEPPKKAQTLIKLGTVLLKTGSADEAVAAFQKAIELEPEAGAAYTNLARALASQGKYREAVTLFEKSIDLLDNDKDKAQALNGLGNAHRKLQDYESAIRSYHRAAELAHDGGDLVSRARLSLLSNVSGNQ
jgi:tetratricopeptide (TPR) repeat protein